MKNLKARHSGPFICQINQEDSHQIVFIVKVVQNGTLKTPVILKDGLQHVTKGSSLNVSCTVNIGIDNSFAFNWITPRKSVITLLYNVLYNRK